MINKISYSPAFKAVYLENSDFNKIQRFKANEIINTFQTLDFSEQKRQTHEDCFEKMGYDFIISPSVQDNAVNLTGYYKLETKDRGYGSYETTWKNKFLVGEYEYDSEFCINDVYKKIYENIVNKKLLFMATTLAVVLASVPILKNIFKNNYVEPVKNRPALVTDSIKQACDTTLKDTLKLAPKVKGK